MQRHRVSGVCSPPPGGTALPMGGLRRVGGAVVLVSFAVGCGGGGGGNGGDDGTAQEPARCDQDVNTAAFYDDAELVHHQGHHEMTGDVDFTLAEWADAFTAPALGMSPAEVVAGVEADEIYRRHVLQGVLTHAVGPDPWMPMTDRATCDRLAAQLDEAREAAARFPTVADAVAAGYGQGDTYYAGLGVHFQDYALLGEFDPGRPVQLLYEGDAPESRLVGLSYVMELAGDEPPEGFAGDNDVWHRHRSFCLDTARRSLNLAADVLSADECMAIGGTHIPNETLWMLHAWVVSGCESDWGIFSAANPRLPHIPQGARLVSGCTAGSDDALAGASP
jgi:hypothetical protein